MHTRWGKQTWQEVAVKQDRKMGWRCAEFGDIAPGLKVWRKMREQKWQDASLEKKPQGEQSGAFATFPRLLHDACLVECLTGKPFGLSPISPTTVRDDGDHWCLLWASPPLSASPAYCLWSSPQWWGGLCHSFSDEEAEAGGSNLSKDALLVRGSDLSPMQLHLPSVQNRVFKARMEMEQAGTPFDHSVLFLFRSKDFIAWTRVEAPQGRAIWGFQSSATPNRAPEGLEGPVRALYAFYGWLSFMTPKNPFFVLFIADLKLQGLLFLQTYDAYCMTELFFIFVFLSEPWNPVRKFLVQAFGGDAAP